MRLLLDSHVLWWAIRGLPRLSDELKRAYSTTTTRFSTAQSSLYEIAFKASRGRMPTAAMYLPEAVRFSDFREIPLTSLHLVYAARLDWGHGDHGTESCWLRHTWKAWT